MKEGSTLVSKRRKALIKDQNRRFSTERIAQQHDHEIDPIIGSKAGTGKLHMLFKSGDDSGLGEKVSHDGNFFHPRWEGRDGCGINLKSDGRMRHTSWCPPCAKITTNHFLTRSHMSSTLRQFFSFLFSLKSSLRISWE